MGLSQKDIDLRKDMASNQLDTLKKNHDDKQIAFRIFSKYFTGNDSVSKAVTAQLFAYHLLKKSEEIGEVKTILETSPEFKYIRDAIYHVTKKTEA